MNALFENASETLRVRHLAYGSLQLLLVEDDELLRQRLELLLSQSSFDVYGVGSAEEAREAMGALVFPIVVIDRMLGKSDGLALLGELRRQYSTHRVFLLLLSSLDSDDERREGLAAGADAYLSKRADEQELLSTLQTARSLVRLRSKPGSAAAGNQ